MKELNLDLHMHGPYAGGVSKNMLIPVMAEQAKLKGLDVISTNDIVHAKWGGHVEKNLEEESNGIYRDLKANCYFIVGGEVQDKNRVHHVIYLPSLEKAKELREKFLGFGALDCVMCGRPKLRLSAEEIAESVRDLGGIFGPAHAFTPYTGLYGHFDSLEEAYGTMHEKMSFIELGLSADTQMADTMKQNHKHTFVSFSDSHSPWPHRIGREFTRAKMERPDFKSLKRALEKKDEELITLNVGLNPKEGKYHCSACNSCFTKYSMEQAESLGWKCVKCGSPIKRGVRDRIAMLADTEEGESPKFRPRYMHSLPLAEIIQEAEGSKGINTVKVQSKWREFMDAFKNEIEVLADAEEDELGKIDKGVAQKIIAFRKGLVLYIPGGGGDYGRPVICNSEEELEQKKITLKKELSCSCDSMSQKTLAGFSGHK